MEEEEATASPDSAQHISNPAGWKAMPFILANETFERLATFGVMANFMVYLVREFHMDQVRAATIINVWNGVTNFAPLVGAFISDSLTGKFHTIVFGSFASLLGITTLTLTALIPQLRPLSGRHYTATQFGILILGLCFLSTGSGGVRPCSVPFSIDQFDQSTPTGRRETRRFYTWYYTTHTIVQLVCQTLIVYVQSEISWAVGFAIPAVFMALAITFFFMGSKLYLHVKPGGSVFSRIAQVFVAAYRKRKIVIQEEGSCNFCDPQLETSMLHQRNTLTNQFRCLNKAAIVTEGEVNLDEASSKKWSLCSISQVEDVKSILRIIPIFGSSIIGFLAMNQQQTFTISQALKMDLRVIGTKYHVPPGSLPVVSLITIGIWLPFYDRFLLGPLEKLTRNDGGITVLQKVGIGNVFSILTMLVSGFVERKRRNLAQLSSNLAHNPGKMSVFWLAPQLVLVGFSEVFIIVGLIEFYNGQVPDTMRSIGNSLQYLELSIASYLSSLVIKIVHGATGDHNWLTSDVNTSRLDLFYYLIGGLTALNLIFFLFCARKYRYRSP